MNKILTLVAASLFATAAYAQNAQDAAAAAAQAIASAPEAEAPVEKPNYWTKSLLTNINFGQMSFNNWAAGGDNTVTLAAYIDGNANYKRAVSWFNREEKDMSWNNRLQLDYGFLYASSKPLLQKNTDRIYFQSKWAYQIENKFYFSANFDFKSQFATGYEYKTPSSDIVANYDASATSVEDLSKADQRSAWKDARVKKSDFMSPAYTNIAFGVDWKPADWFTASFAPVTGGFVIVAADDQSLRKTYSMKEKADGTYKAARFELGAQLKVDAKFNVNDNFNYTTQVVLFSNYLKNPQNFRVNWDNRFDWKLAKYFTATVITNLIYDDTVYGTDGKRMGLQFKESFALGFTYTFTAKK
ncbi:MAG: DUF3078 domain-containing protein [Bacteroidales bacterium]|nr:DUF3078 domain-containing protein [Bacteroidales bacterium]